MKRLRYSLSLLLLVIIIDGCSQDVFDYAPNNDILLQDEANNNWQSGHSWIDPKDGQEYGTMEVNGQIWMTRNYNYEYEDNSSHYGAGDFWEHGKVVEDDYHVNTREDREKFGRLYSYEAALTAAPDGWRLPCKQDWERLFESLEMNLPFEPGQTFNIPADYYAFNFKSGGRRSAGVGFFDLGKAGYYWSENHEDSNPPYYKVQDRLLNSELNESNKRDLMSVRYIKN